MFGWTVENLGFWFRIGSVAQVKAEKGEGKEEDLPFGGMDKL